MDYDLFPAQLKMSLPVFQASKRGLRSIGYGSRGVISVAKGALSTIINGSRKTVVVAKFNDDIVTTLDRVDESVESSLVSV
jgi:hypothetical protein